MKYSVEDRLTESIMNGNRDLESLKATFASIAPDLIQNQINYFEVRDSIGNGIREPGLLRDFHPEVSLSEIQAILVSSLIERGEINADYLSSLCPDIQQAVIQHKIDSAKIARTQILVNSRSPTIRNLMDPPPDGAIDRSPKTGWYQSGYGTSHTRSHRP